jgi:uncharacterized membrane protein
LDLEDAAVIRRDTKVKLHMTAHHAVAWGSLSGLFWGVLTGLLFAFPIAPPFRCSVRQHGRRVRRCGDLGIKDDFKRRVQELVQPGTPALLVIVRQVTVDRFAEALRPYGGTVLQTSLPHGTEQELMKALHGDNSSAPAWERPAAAAVARA